jgi:hypothetical protein
LGTETESSAIPSSFIARLTGVFTSPVRTFEDVLYYPRFFAPFSATVVLFAGFWGAVYLKLGLSGMAVAVVQYFRRGTLVRQDEIDFVLQFSHAVAPAVLIGGTITILAHLIIIAWVGARLADLFFSVRLRLRVAITMACYAYLAKTIALTVLGIPMLLYGDIKGLNFGNPLPTNVAFFLDPTEVSRILYAFLQSLDLLQWWYFALLGVGFSTPSDDRSSPVVLGVSLAVLWMGWNVFFAALRDVLLGA